MNENLEELLWFCASSHKARAHFLLSFFYTDTLSANGRFYATLKTRDDTVTRFSFHPTALGYKYKGLFIFNFFFIYKMINNINHIVDLSKSLIFNLFSIKLTILFIYQNPSLFIYFLLNWLHFFNSLIKNLNKILNMTILLIYSNLSFLIYHRLN